jgi:capsular polysaccharide biosynthesis protein
VELEHYLRSLQKSWILIFTCTLSCIAGAAGGVIAMRPPHRTSTQVDVSEQAVEGPTFRGWVQRARFARQAVTERVTGLRPGEKVDEELTEKRETGEQRINQKFSHAKIAQFHLYCLDEEVVSVRHAIERINSLEIPWKNAITP